MKNLKLYEDLIKDLYGLGITEGRILIDVIAKEKFNKEGNKIITIDFPKLNKEGKIGFRDIIDSIINEEFEIDLVQELRFTISDLYMENISKYLLELATKQKSFGSWTPEEFLNKFCGFWGARVIAELKDSGKIIATGNNYYQQSKEYKKVSLH